VSLLAVFGGRYAAGFVLKWVVRHRLSAFAARTRGPWDDVLVTDSDLTHEEQLTWDVAKDTLRMSRAVSQSLIRSSDITRSAIRASTSL